MSELRELSRSKRSYKRSFKRNRARREKSCFQKGNTFGKRRRDNSGGVGDNSGSVGDNSGVGDDSSANHLLNEDSSRRRVCASKIRRIQTMAEGSSDQGMRFRDKVAIVTGGCLGIGRGCVDVFTEHGGRVAIFDINDAEGEKITGKANNGEIYYIHCDMTNEEQIKAAIQKTIEKFGTINCLVNNAGWHPPARTIDEFSSEDFRKLLDLNLMGYFLCCKYALPYLRQSKGNIINVSSGADQGQPDSVTYCATKGGVTSMTRGLALDEAKNGVRVNSISPGSTVTPMLEEWLDSLTPEENAKAKKMNVLGRFCEPRENGHVALFLATDATHCTGIEVCSR